MSRVGVIVPRHQHSAVDRNRVKRRLRELVRLELLPALRERTASASVDVSLRARREAYGATREALARDVLAVRLQLATPSAAAAHGSAAHASAPPTQGA
jgi:ribonuclease P protein component